MRSFRAWGCLLLLGAAPSLCFAASYVPGMRVVASDATGMTIEYVLPGYRLEPVRTEAGTLQRVRVDGLAATVDEGQPELPMGGAWVALPPTGAASVRLLEEEIERVPDVDVSPVYRPEFVRDASGAELPMRRFVRDSQAYARPGPYPQSSAALDGESWMRFQRVAALKVYPIRYEAMSRTLLVAKRLVVRVDFEAPAARGLATLAAAGLESAPADDRQYEPVYRGAVLNYDAARSWRARPLTRAGVTPAGPARPHVTGTGNPEWKVRVDTTGVWRVTFAQLAAQSFPAGIAIDAVVAFRRDTTVALQPEPWTMAEIPIDVVDGNQNSVFDAGDFLVLPVRNWAERTGAGWSERRYGDAEIVWISYKSAGTGARVASAASWLDAVAPAMPTSFPSTRRYERNFNYYGFPLDVTRYDQFTWTDGNFDKTPIDTLFADLLDLEPAGGSVRVTAEWIGRSNLSHVLSADWVRPGDNLATNLWTDTTAFSRFPLDAIRDFDAALAGEGLNRLRISGHSTAPNGSSQAGFNWFEVTYPRRYVARNNRLDLNTGSATDTTEVDVDGFTGSSAPPVYVYDITSFDAPVRLTVDPSQVVPSAAGWKARLQVVAAPGAPRRLVAAADVAPLPDAAITRDTPSSLYLTPSADFVILTYDAFEPQVERLADFRRQKGIATLVAKTQDVYDEFNGGRKSQFAVRRFLSYALQHWNTRFVLLVGDASEDAQGWLGTSAPDFVPTPVIHGPVGVAEGLEVVPSDNWYVLGLTGTPIDSDFTADMVIGRWTAGSAQQAADLVDKSIRYETNDLTGAWRNRAVLSADDDFSAQTTFGGGGGGGFAYCERLSEQVFQEINQVLEGLIKNEGGYRDFDVRPFYMSDLLTSVQPFPDPNCTFPGIGRDLFATLDYVRDHTAPALFTILNGGAAFWNFQGHGNAVQMTHEELYYTGLRDVDLIFNDGKPWIFSGYACHINNYANINEGGVFGDGAGERMVNIPSKGAIASIASVGYELLPSSAATQFNVHVYRAFFVDPPYVPFAGQSGARVFVGEASTLGALRMAATTSGLERLAVRTYVLLGDPLASVNFGPPRFFAHATDRDSIASGQAYYPKLDQDSVTVEIDAVDESALSNLTIAEEGEGARASVPDSEVVITPPYPDTVGNRYTIRLAATPRPASYDVVFSATDRGGLTGQFRLRFVLEASLTQQGQVVRSGDPVVPGTDLVWKVRSPARLTASDFALLVDNVSTAFTAAEDPADTTGRTWAITFLPSLAAGSHKAQLDVALARGGAVRQVEFDVLGGELSVRYAYAFPNPFHDHSTFNFFLGSDGPADVLLRVFTVSGTPVWERFERDVPPGYHQWEWDGRDQAGKTVAFGAYLFRLASAQGGGRKTASAGKIVRAPERKTTTAVTP